MATIRYCENNYGYGTDEAVEKAKGLFPTIEVEVSGCWGECDACSSGAYVFVDHDMIEAEDGDDLLDKIKEELAE